MFLAIAIGLDGESTSGQERAFGVVANGVFAIALLGGLWFLRSGRVSTSVSLGGIVLGLLGGIVWFWMLIPPILAFVVLWFGVVKGGLMRELRTA